MRVRDIAHRTYSKKRPHTSLSIAVPMSQITFCSGMALLGSIAGSLRNAAIHEPKLILKFKLMHEHYKLRRLQFQMGQTAIRIKE